jgi:thiamine pyrophosphate-dependent acetolactate synthase large subunit-like protein
MPKRKKIAHATLDPTDINKDVPVDLAAIGDSGLTLDALLKTSPRRRTFGKGDRSARPRTERRCPVPSHIRTGNWADLEGADVLSSPRAPRARTVAR